MLGKNYVPPNYIRAINLINKTPDIIEAIFKFKSNQEQKYLLNPNEEIKVEKSIDQGTFSSVDPITSLNISTKSLDNDKIKSKEINFVAKGVEISKYEINYNENEELLLKKI